jgi:dimethylargininase
VLRVGRTLYVGASQRTNAAGIAQLREHVAPFGYDVVAVPVTGCLHLKTACSYLGRETLLVNRAWIDGEPLVGYNCLDVAPAELWAANALVIGEVVLLPAGFPETQSSLERAGFQVETLETGELQKAEAGLTCLSIIFDADAG